MYAGVVVVIRVLGGVSLPILVLFFWLCFSFLGGGTTYCGGMCIAGGRAGFEGKEEAVLVMRGWGECPSCPSGVTAVP